MPRSSTVTVASRSGLHARPAKLIAQTSARSGAAVTITKGELEANGASLLALLSLGVNHGDTVLVTVTGADENQVLRDISELLSTDLDAG